MSQYFHFTLGPVQGFVAQARRTRDFWAGSFLLSWLSGVAMCQVDQQAGSEILFPEADEDYLDWVRGNGKGNRGPAQGSIPNRFKAKVANDFEPAKVTHAVQTAWQALADIIWKEDFGDIAPSNTQKIWEEQVATFWEMNWALVDDESVSNVLDRRKNWRSHIPPDQGGVKCMMMEGWQELSGAARPHREGKRILDEFWFGLRNSKGNTGIKTDLREGEHLCAMAYIKRRFVRYFQNFDVEMPGNWQCKGWKVPSAVPSVSYIAAAPWLAKLVRSVGDQKSLQHKFQSFYDCARAVVSGNDERDTSIKCVEDAVKFTRDDGVERSWTTLDGSVYFESALDNAKNWDTTQDNLTALKNQLSSLRKMAEVGSASPFYALLLMDGDSLGAQMSDVSKQKKISSALNNFTRNVPEIVTNHDGFLIYAGGDDVMALVTLEQAFQCSVALHSEYRRCFADVNIASTLSGAIEFAHIKVPLTRVLKDAHDLLDNVAKEKTGRDSIAVRVWKGSGMQLQWSMPWEKAVVKEEEAETETVVLDRMASEFRRNDEQSAFSSKFFYRIRERFDLLNPKNDAAADSVLNFDQACDLMACEYLASGINQKRGKEHKLNHTGARNYIEPLLEQCQDVRRRLNAGTEKSEYDRLPKLYVDGALLVRFLAQKGIEQ